jgi:PII-like signaling protein
VGEVSGTFQAKNVPSDVKTVMQSTDMLRPGLAKKVTIHLNEDTSASHDFLYNEIFTFLRDRGVAGATIIRPQSGFGSHHRVHTAEAGTGEREHLPIRIEFIESKEASDSLLPALCELVTDGLIEVQDTTILKTVAREEHS